MVGDATGMDKFLLQTFQRQVEFQCQAFRVADLELRAAIIREDHVGMWIAIQNLLTAAANISKACWGQGGKLLEERRELRKSVGLADDSPLQNVVMRNHFEHFDERIDEWWKTSKLHNMIDFCKGEHDALINISEERDVFRNFSPRTGDIIFWGQKFSLVAMASEVEKVSLTLRQHANKTP